MARPEVLALPLPKELPGDGDCFRVLGISPEATQERVKRAYFSLARYFHPDLNRSPNAIRSFIRLQRAYAEAIAGDGVLAHLARKCKGVWGKKKLAEMLRPSREGLRQLRSIEVHTGMTLEQIIPQAQLFAGGANTNEEVQKAIETGWILTLKCPSCKHKKRCDEATGFAEVVDMHERMQALP